MVSLNRPKAGYFKTWGRSRRAPGRSPTSSSPIREGENGFAAQENRSAYHGLRAAGDEQRAVQKGEPLGLRAHGKIIYCASLPGTIFLRDNILEQHYPTQFRFARDPRGELSRYPEIRSRVEKHFGVSVETARVLGLSTPCGRWA